MKKLFTPTKLNSLTPEDEMRQLERELMPLRAREAQPRHEISTAKRGLASEPSTPIVMMDGTHGLDPKRQAAAAKKKDQLSTSRTTLVRAEREMQELVPTLIAAVNRLQQLRRDAETDHVNAALRSSPMRSKAPLRPERNSNPGKRNCRICAGDS